LSFAELIYSEVGFCFYTASAACCPPIRSEPAAPRNLTSKFSWWLAMCQDDPELPLACVGFREVQSDLFVFRRFGRVRPVPHVDVEQDVIGCN
jgi:hypothetical protein